MFSTRYGVELERAKKPALRAILQGDASAARPLVLCVSRVYTPEELGVRRGAAAAVIEVQGPHKIKYRSGFAGKYHLFPSDSRFTRV